MNRVGTIRFRLTAWYTVIMTIIVTAVALMSWVAARESLAVTVDRSLSRDMDVFRASIRMHSRREPDDIARAIESATVVGLRDTLVRVFDTTGSLVYQSPGLDARLTAEAPHIEGADLTFRTAPDADDGTVRLAAGTFDVQNHRYIAEVVRPLTVSERSLARFGQILALAIPVALLLASVSGYWLSGRALRPVEQITADVRRISAQHLSDRLAVPAARDELRQLSETLNDLLARIDQSVSQLRQFTADASHELRAPLALIHTAAEFALHRERPREELVEALQTILRESQHTTNLVNNLLVLARADASEHEARMVPLNVAALCQDAVDQASALAVAKQISVSADLATISVIVKGDETALRRLLLILVDNAIKYTTVGGHLDLQLSVANHAAVITVHDTGIGIATDHIPRVFDRFWRADKVRSRAAGGSGLGLAIARWIVDHHDGSISVASEPGKGSTFTVRLPLARESAVDCAVES